MLKQKARKLLTFCWQLLLHVRAQLYTTMQVFKDALISINLDSGIGLSALVKTAWLVPMLFIPNLFSHNIGFYAMSKVMSQSWWVVTTLALISFDGFVLRSHKFLMQVAGLVVGMLTWFFMSSLLSQSAYHGRLGLPSSPSAYSYFLGASLLCYNLIRLCSHHMARQEALRILELEKEVMVARGKGELWAQPLKSETALAHNLHF